MVWQLSREPLGGKYQIGNKNRELNGVESVAGLQISSFLLNLTAGNYRTPFQLLLLAMQLVSGEPQLPT